MTPQEKIYRPINKSCEGCNEPLSWVYPAAACYVANEVSNDMITESV